MKLYQIDYNGNISEMSAEIVEPGVALVNGRKTPTTQNWRAIRTSKEQCYKWLLDERQKMVNKAAIEYENKQRLLRQAKELCKSVL